MTTSKRQLIKMCIKGDKKAQDTFYELYKAKTMGICRRYAKNNIDAEDIFHEAFIKILRNLSHLKNPEALESWIRQTVVRTAINHYHQNLKFVNQHDINEVMIDNGNYQNILSKISNEELINYVNRLPDGYRLVFNLYVVDGYTHREIAEMLNISINTSKSQLRSAKQQLKKKLKMIGVNRYEKIV